MKGHNARRAAAWFALLGCASVLAASHPQVTGLVPRGAQRGTEITVTITGSRLQELEGLVLFRKGIEVVSVQAERENRGKITIRIAKDCPLGAHPMLVRTGRGLSNLKLFMVGAMPEVAEQEPNNLRTAAQKVPCNVTINGRITAEDVDVFAVPVRAGERMNIEVEGLRLGDREFDPHLTVHDDRGRRLARVDDTIFGQMDPLTSLGCERDGVWYLTLRENARGGANNCYYRLHVGTFPRPTVVFPAGGRPGTAFEATLLGAGPPTKTTLKVPATVGLHEVFIHDDRGTSPTPVHLVAVDRENVFEAEDTEADGARLSSWWSLGPFANPRDKKGAYQGHVRAILSGKQLAGPVIDPEAEYPGRDGKVRWKKQPKLRDNVIFDLRKIVPKSDASVLYLARTLDAATARRVLFLCSGDDTIRVFLNGKRVLDDARPSSTKTNEHRLLLDLNKGRNTLVVKVSNGSGSFGFFGRVLDPHRLRSYGRFPRSCSLNGIIRKPGETDRYVFLANKGEQIDFQAVSRRLRSALDPVLGCYCTHDRFYAGNDDTRGIGMDSLLRFRAPFTGEFVLQVRDMLLSGGDDFVYRVEVSKPQARRLALRANLPGFQYEWTAEVPTGGRSALMIASVNLDQNAGVQVQFAGLPKGVQAQVPPFTPGTTMVPVVFTAAAGSPRGHSLVEVTAKATKKKIDLSNAVFRQPVETVQARNQRTYLTRQIDRLPVAVTKSAPFTLTVPPIPVPLVHNSPIKVPFSISRAKDFTQSVRVRMLYNPAGITSNQVTIPKGKTKGELTLYARTSARPEVHKIVLVATGSVRGAPLSSSSELIDLAVSKPWITASVGTVRGDPGTKLVLPITFAAKRAFPGKIEAEWVGLPRGVTCDPIRVHHQTKKLELPLAVSAKAPPGRHRSFRLRLKVQTPQGSVVHDFRSGEIRIDRPRSSKAGS